MKTAKELQRKFPFAKIITKFCDITSEKEIYKLFKNLKKIKFI